MSKDFTCTLFNLFKNVMNYSNFWKIDWTYMQFDCISKNYLENSANLKQGAHIHQPTWQPGQYLTHAHSHITQAVATMDSCFTLTGAHQQGKAIRSMNGKNPHLKDPLLPRRVQSTPLSTSSTQHMWELLAGNRTAVLPRHAWRRQIMGWCMCAPCFAFVFWK